jgi:hypothetical protein
MVGWVKIYRKLTDWEWYNDSHMVHLFIHLLLMANTEDNEWKGVMIKRGQLVTGRKSLSRDTGIPERTVRTCLSRLEVTSEVTIKTTNRYSIITICNYEDYQPIKKKSRQPAANQPPTNDHNIRIKEEENKNKYIGWAENSKDHVYKKFTAWLLDEEVPKCMVMDDQIDEKMFTKLYAEAKRDNALIKRTINNMENKPDLNKKYTSFYRTLTNWVKLEIERRGK